MLATSQRLPERILTCEPTSPARATPVLRSALSWSRWTIAPSSMIRAVPPPTSITRPISIAGAVGTPDASIPVPLSANPGHASPSTLTLPIIRRS